MSRYLGRIGPTPVVLVSAGLRPYRGEWPAVVVDFASKALGAEAILGLALKAASGSIKTEGEP